MKLSEYKNEEALEVLADIVEPAVDIFSDKELIEIIKAENKGKAISYALKEHKKSVLEILAAMERKPVSEYECSVLTLPTKILEILNDKELVSFFSSQLPMEAKTSSGSATETIEEDVQ